VSNFQCRILGWVLLIGCIFIISYFFSNGATPPSGPGPPRYRGFTITLRHTPHSVGLLWTSDQPDAETSTWQHTTLTRDRHPCSPGIRTHNTSKRAAADPHLRPRGHWDRPIFFFQWLDSPLGAYTASFCEASRSHFLDTPHSVGLLWTSDQLVAETSTWQHTTLTRDRHPCPRWNSNPQS
jgi:hypothetical protein